jgi:hypothetical protein
MKNQELLPVGSVVKIAHQPGEYKVKGYNKDGSYSLYGGASGHGSFRDVFDVKPVSKKRSKALLEEQ